MDQFLEILDASLEQGFGPLSLRRGTIENITVPNKVASPRRFDMMLLLRGQTWRRIQVEIAPDEGIVGSYAKMVPAVPLTGFGLPSVGSLAGLSLAYQIAQKIHAVTDPHNPPDAINDRARDVVDLILLRDLATGSGHPTLTEIGDVVRDIFAAWAREAVWGLAMKWNGPHRSRGAIDATSRW